MLPATTITRIPSHQKIPEITESTASLLEKANEKFDHLKKTPTSLMPWINSLPKGAELHIHLLGSIYPSELLHIAINNKLMFDPQTCLFSKQEDQSWFTKAKPVSAEELLTNSDYLTSFENAVSMRNTAHSKVNPHDHFMYKCFTVIESVISNAKPDEIYHLIELVRRNACRQHIRYIELMVGLSAVQQIVETLSQHSTCEDPKINFIIELSRLQTEDTFREQVLQSIQLIQKCPKIKAYNIVGPEDNPNSQWNFNNQMAVINQCYQLQSTPIVLHAGELTSQYATPLSMSDRIEKSILEGHAVRIGHGVCLDSSTDPGRVMTLMKTRRIAVEICLTSNDKILNVTGKHHPIRTYVKEGVKVVIASDDPGVNLEDLNDQFYRLVYEHHFDLHHLIEFTRNSLEYSLLSGESIFENGDVKRFTHLFENCDKPNWVPCTQAKIIMEQSPKAKEQVGHERDLVAYLMKLVELG